jgi:hypothetical protein
VKNDRGTEGLSFDLPAVEPVDLFAGIRCPICAWQPDSGSRWSCDWSGAPEPFFHSCGTVWNTFTTGGRCPGCTHQWRWTSCLRCGGWSPHLDWYVDPDDLEP